MAVSGQHLGWIKKGNTLLEWKQHKQAIAAYDKAISLKSNCFEAWLGKGQALLDSREYDLAIAAFEKLIKLQPQDFTGYYYKAATLEEADRLEATADFYQTVTALMPQEPGAWFFQGVFLTRQQQYEAAIDCFDRAIAINLSPMYLMARSIALENLERYQAALDDLDRLLLTGDSALVWISRAQLLEKLEQYEEALDSYGQASHCDPRLMEPWENRVRLLLQLDQVDKAQTIALTLTGVFDDVAAVWVLMGQVTRWQQQYEAAIAHYSRALELDAAAADACYGLAICSAQLDQAELAQKHLEQAIALDANYREKAQAELALAALLTLPAIAAAPADETELLARD